RAGSSEQFLEYLLDNSGGWVWLKDPKRQVEVLAQARAALANLDGDPARQGRLARSIAKNLRLLGLHEPAIEIAGIAVAAFQAAGLDVEGAQARLDRGDYRAQANRDLDLAEADLDAAYEVLRLTSGPLALATIRFKLAEVGRLRGRGIQGDLLRASADSLLEAPAAKLPDWYALACEVSADLATTGDHELAHRLLDATRARLDADKPVGYATERLRLEILEVELSLRSGSSPEDLTRLDQIWARAEGLTAGNGPAVGIMIGRLGSLLFDLGRYPESARFFRRALEQTQEWGGQPALRAKLACNLATVLHDQGRHEDSLRYAQLAVALRSKDGEPLPAAAHCLQGAARSLVSLGRLDEAFDALSKARKLYALSEVPRRVVAYCERDLGEVHRRRQEPSLASRHFRVAATSLASDVDEAPRQIAAELWEVVASLEFKLGHQDEYVEAVEHARDLRAGLDDDLALLAVEERLANALYHVGRFAEAADVYEDVLERIDPKTEPERYVDLAGFRGEALVQNSRLEAALANFRDAR
ncbi:MAG: tetratricopeptide repeat protein, partial [Planctomycetes bacterium]|nr:tetratricopeptide repeat protein [Planctomycetota bacterium]